MTRAIVRALAVAVLCALLGTAFTAFSFAVHPSVDISFATDPPRLLSGTFPPERDDAVGLTFAWSGREVALRIPGLDRNVSWTLALRVRGARADAADNPELTFVADGVVLDTRATRTDFDTILVSIPARQERPRGVLIVMQSSKTFVPGPSDSRALGVMIDEISLSPDGVALPPRPTFAGVGTSAAVLGAAVSLIGVTTGSAVGAAVLLSAGAAAMLTRGFGSYTDYPLDAARLAACIAVVLVLATRLIERQRRQPLRNTARFVAAFSAGAMFLKLLVLLHPDMPIGDAMFHAHRFQGVLAGRLYFTSVAPGGYQFPYAPGFYLFAAPFARLVARGAADVALLRIVAIAADTLAAVFLYVVVVRRWGNRTTGAIAVAAYHLLPLDFRVMTVGNLTNAFAQSVSVGALAAIAASWTRWGRPAGVALLTALLAAAFMSHSSTFAILFVSAALIAVLFYWKRGPALPAAAADLLVATLAAWLLAMAIYYLHFMDTYRSEFARIASETAAAAPDAGGRGIWGRLASVPTYVRYFFGVPALMLALVGAWEARRRYARDPLTLALAGWTASCALFLAIGVLTPVDMRYYLASIPAVAVAAAAGASALWSGGRVWRAAGAAGLIAVLWNGILTWWTTF